jgi:hypothetical protein
MWTHVLLPRCPFGAELKQREHIDEFTQRICLAPLGLGQLSGLILLVK